MASAEPGPARPAERAEVTMGDGKRKKESPQDAGEAPGDELQKLDKIRDILFGEQIRQLESRLETVESGLSKRVGTVDAQLRQQVAELQGKLDSEREERVAAARSHDRRMQELSKTLEAAVQELGAGKTDRAALARMLTNMATQLEDEAAG